MQGLGNDYVYVDLFRETVADPVALARRVSDRRFGIGGDGLILVCPSETAAVRMEMYNADGSRAEMCGNGLRCVAKYAFDEGHVTETSFPVETDDGVKRVDLKLDDGRVAAVRVDMGEPRLERAEIPMEGDPGRVVAETMPVQDHQVVVTCVSMGNPHCVIFVDDAEAFPVRVVGPCVETHPAFPRRTNTEFVQVLSRTEVRQRTWERGSGETFACGTGACAVVVAGRLNDLLDERVTVHLTGGDLLVEWAGEGHPVYMTGPAVEVFRGEMAD